MLTNINAKVLFIQKSKGDSNMIELLIWAWPILFIFLVIYVFFCIFSSISLGRFLIMLLGVSIFWGDDE